MLCRQDGQPGVQGGAREGVPHRVDEEVGGRGQQAALHRQEPRDGQHLQVDTEVRIILGCWLLAVHNILFKHKVFYLLSVER